MDQMPIRPGTAPLSPTALPPDPRPQLAAAPAAAPAGQQRMGADASRMTRGGTAPLAGVDTTAPPLPSDETLDQLLGQLTGGSSTHPTRTSAATNTMEAQAANVGAMIDAATAAAQSDVIRTARTAHTIVGASVRIFNATRAPNAGGTAPAGAEPASTPQAPKAPSTTANTIGAVGGALAVMSAINNTRQVEQGIEEIESGHAVRGATHVVGALAGLGQNAASMVNGAAAVARITNSATAAARTASSLAEAIGPATFVGGRVLPALGVVSGIAQTVAAVQEGNTTKAATGLMTAAGSVLMVCPPPAQVAGIALVATAAIIDNWKTISGVAGKAWNALPW